MRTPALIAARPRAACSPRRRRAQEHGYEARFTGDTAQGDLRGKDGEKRGRLRFEPMGEELRCGDGDRPRIRVASRRRGSLWKRAIPPACSATAAARLKAEVKESGSFTLHRSNPASPAICSKAARLTSTRFHPDRVTRPLEERRRTRRAAMGGQLWDEATGRDRRQTAASSIRPRKPSHSPKRP